MTCDVRIVIGDTRISDDNSLKETFLLSFVMRAARSRCALPDVVLNPQRHRRPDHHRHRTRRDPPAPSAAAAHSKTACRAPPVSCTRTRKPSADRARPMRGGRSSYRSPPGHIRIREHLARQGALTADQYAERLAACDADTERVVWRAQADLAKNPLKPGRNS